MKVVLIIAGIVIGLIAIVLLIGAMLPRKHAATREIVLRKPASEIFATMRDFTAAPSWRPDLERVEMLESVDGHVRYREHSKQGVVTYEVVEESAPLTLITRIVDRDLGYFGTWTYRLWATESGTQVRITEDGEVPNVLFRFMSRFVFGHTATMESYLRALGRKFGEEVTPK